MGFTLTINILITIIIFSLLPFFFNYILLANNIPNGLILLFVINFIVSFIIGYIISYNSGQSQCNNSHFKVCFWKGFKVAFYSTIVYLIIFFIPFFKSGFIEILGDNFFTNSLAEAILLSLSNISLTIDNYFTSIKDNCQLDFKLSATAWHKIEKKLNSRRKKDPIEKVEITT